MQRSQLIGKRFRPVVDLQWLPHSVVDWELVLGGRCMCNHFCARSALVRKAELYRLLQSARGSDLLPVTPATRVLVVPADAGLEHYAKQIGQFCDQLCAVSHLTAESSCSKGQMWLLKAGNSSNGNGIHLVDRLEQVASLLNAEQRRDSWCVQEFVRDAALVHGCRYSVRMLLLLASSQVRPHTRLHVAFSDVCLSPSGRRPPLLRGMGVSPSDGPSLSCALCPGDEQTRVREYAM
jgi:hypothetical protein